MLNDSWGRQSDAFFFNQQVVAAPLDAQNRYVFEEFRNRGLTDLRENARSMRSAWVSSSNSASTVKLISEKRKKPGAHSSTGLFYASRSA